VWQHITFQHSSVQATVIGRRQFKDLCVATGVSEQVTDVAPFKFIPCQIRVGIEQDKKGLYDDKNKVSRVWHIDAQVKQPKRSAKPAQPAKPVVSATTTTAATPTASPTAAAQPTATAVPAAKPATNTASGANGNIPPWRQAKPSLSEDLNDSIPD
jgi:hypothetical protein